MPIAAPTVRRQEPIEALLKEGRKFPPRVDHGGGIGAGRPVKGQAIAAFVTIKTGRRWPLVDYALHPAPAAFLELAHPSIPRSYGSPSGHRRPPTPAPPTP